MLVHQGKGSGTPTEPHHTPFPEAETSHPTTSSIPLPSIPTAPIPPVTQPDTTPIRQYTRRARIAQSSALPTIADEPASLVRDEIVKLKDRVKVLEDKEDVAATQSGDDAPIKGRSINEGEAAAERIMVPFPLLVQLLQEERVARKLEEQQEKENMRMNEQIARDAEVARIHADKELQGMIDSLDQSNETIAKYLQEYQDFASELPLEKRIELISDLKREYYMAVIKSNLGWRFKDFKGMTFKEIEAKFVEVWKQVEDFIPIGSKEETKRLKKKGLNLEKEQVKKQKLLEEAPEIETSTEEFTKEKMKEMMQLVPVEDVYVQALQVKHPIIDWKVYTEGQRSYWQIIRLGGSSACYQFFIDLLKQLDREDLNQLWALVKEYISIRLATSEKEMEL
nr:hypothetical protein [Tanacetum cinerariifolium]